MPHLRERYLLTFLRKAAGFSPLVGVLGHRQVGKTTLLEGFCRTYRSFDRRNELLAATEDPESYLATMSGGLVGLDECQLVPGLFPALKERVRVHKRPGQYILSGSVRFTSKKAIRESLTGRIVNLELFPFVLSELNHDPLPDFFPKAFGISSFENRETSFQAPGLLTEKRRKLFNHYFRKGGLPGICFVKDDAIRNQKIEDQLETLLERDLRQIETTRATYPVLRELVQTLSQTQGHPLNFQKLSRQSGISVPTLKRILYALDAIFLIRHLPVEGDGKNPVIFFEDQGERRYLAQGRVDALSELTHFIYLNARVQFHYRAGTDTRFFQYRTRGGAIVPIALRAESGALGIIPMETDTPSRSDLFTANSFLKNYADSKVIFIHPGNKIEVLHPRMLVAPILLAV